MHEQLLAWFADHARDLPWRSPDTSAWGVLVSEVMLQQTPVARVTPAYQAWMQRWPAPAALADEPVAEAIRAWGRLGYPRRAVRLHAAAAVITNDHAGVVPRSVDQLRALPGVGEYTAAAVAAFAYGQRVAVLDTNVRRVLSRVCTGQAMPRPHLTAGERALAESLLPPDGPTAARWSVAVMELGALVCSVTAPRCTDCPLSDRCRWVAQGRPPAAHARRSQPFTGTDRQARGRLMQVLRAETDPVARSVLDSAWHDEEQRDRALQSLLDDGLAAQDETGRFHLPR